MTEERTAPQAYVVLGANGGIGSELCRRLRQAGARVLLAGRNERALAELGSELDAPTAVVDGTDPDAVVAAAERAAEEFGQLNGIANCIGSLLLKPAHLTSNDEWDATIATNLRSAFGTVKAAAKTMRRSGGSVVLVSSAAARVGIANHEAIAAAKAGILGLTLSAAATYGPRGIRVNAVAPGLVRTPLTQVVTGSEANEKASRALHVLGRLGEPSDIAPTIAWLLGPDSSWVTGQVFGLDGGLGTVHAR